MNINKSDIEYHFPKKYIGNNKNLNSLNDNFNYKSPEEINRLSIHLSNSEINQNNNKLNEEILNNKDYLEYKNVNLKKFSIDDFEIGSKLGKGKFGEVFLAREKKTNYIVALKILDKNTIKKYNAQKQMVREIKLHSYLDHPNIIKLYGFFHDELNIYLILEYAPDGELYKELKAQPEKKFDEKKAAFYIKQIIEAFIYIHNYDIIHRDLKPENLLIFDDIIKIADFGWSVYAPESTLRQTFCGTLDYVPPEMVDGIKYDKKTDNWSIGILIYEFLTGFPPFEKNSQIDTLNCIKEGNLNYPDFLSNEAKDFISKFLVLNPLERIELKDALLHPFIKKISN